MAGECLEQLPAPAIPQINGHFGAGAGRHPAILAERDAIQRAAVPGQAAAPPLGLRATSLPQMHQSVGAGGNEQPVRPCLQRWRSPPLCMRRTRDGHGPQRARLAAQHVQRVAGDGVPHAHTQIGAAADQQLPMLGAAPAGRGRRAKVQRPDRMGVTGQRMAQLRAPLGVERPQADAAVLVRAGEEAAIGAEGQGGMHADPGLNDLVQAPFGQAPEAQAAIFFPARQHAPIATQRDGDQ